MNIEISHDDICGLVSMYTHNLDDVDISISNKSFIAPYPLSIFLKILNEYSKNRQVNVTLPSKESAVTDYLYYSGFISALSNKICVTNLEKERIPVNPSVLVHFEHYEKCRSYLSSLTANQYTSAQFKTSIGNSIDPVSLRLIVLEELAKNAFQHGNGADVSQLLVKFKPESKATKSKIGNPLQLTVTYSDAGPGLVSTLQDSTPADYYPLKKYTSSIKNLNRHETIALYAFEFSSTGNKELRSEVIEQFSTSYPASAGSVPTGLFLLTTIARKYKGIIQVRTSDVFLELNYSKSGIAKLSRIKLKNSNKAPFVLGTHIYLSLPADKTSEVSKPAQVKTGISNCKILSTRLLDFFRPDLPLNKSVDDFFTSYEAKITTAIELGYSDFVIWADSMESFDSKLLPTIFSGISFISRGSIRLIIAGVQQEQLDALKIYFLQASPKDLLSSQPAYILTNSQGTDCVAYGDTNHPFATYIRKDTADNTQLSLDPDLLVNICITSLRQISEDILRKARISDSNSYFQISNQYYTQSFFNIRSLLNNTLISQYVRLDISRVCSLLKPKIVFSFTNSLHNLLTSDIRFDDYDLRTVEDNENEYSAMMKVFLSISREDKVLLVTDVICTGKSIENVLSSYDTKDQFSIFTIIDGRLNAQKYFTVQTSEEPRGIDLYRILESPIQVLGDLSQIAQSNVVVIDTRTHSPTKVITAENDSDISEKDLLNMAVASKAIDQGHIEYRGKHFDVYVDFSKLFPSLFEVAGRWIDTATSQAQTYNPEFPTHLFVLDEDKGWEDNLISSIDNSKFENIVKFGVKPLTIDPSSVEEHSNMIIVIPAIASGETLKRCLEFSSSVGCGVVRILIILGRISTNDKIFYQKIIRYTGIANVRINILSDLSIPSYPSYICPTCNLIQLLEKIAADNQEFISLTQALEKMMDSLSSRGPNLDNLKLPEQDALKVSIRHSIFNRDTLNLSKLIISNKQSIQGYIEIVGSLVIRELLSFDDALTLTVEKGVRNSILDYVLSKIKNPNNELGIYFLVGVEALLPNEFNRLLSIYIPKLLKENNLHLLENVVIFFLLRDKIYSHHILLFRSESTENNAISSLLRDVQKYPYWFGNEVGRPLATLTTLIKLLSRSTEWGNIINVILHNSSKWDDSTITTKITEFLERGMPKTLNLLQIYVDYLKLSASPSLGKISEIVPQLVGEADTILGSINLAEIDLAINSLENVRNISRILLDYLKSEYLNPVDFFHIADSIKKEYSFLKDHLRIEIVLPDDDFALYLCDSDVEFMIRSIMDNAERFLENDTELSDDQFYIRFIFEFYSPFCKLIVDDNIPWPAPLVLDGGGMDASLNRIKQRGGYYLGDIDKMDGKFGILFYTNVGNSREYDENSNY